MQKIVIFIMVTTLVVVSKASLVQQEEQQLEINKTQNGNQTVQPYYPRLKFAISVLDSLQKAKPSENIFYSPHSVLQALLLGYFGAAGETETELKHVLGLDWAKNKSDVADWYELEKEVQADRFQNSSVEFISADKLYMDEGIKIRYNTWKDFFSNILHDSII